MAITVKHKFVSAIADESDASVVRPSNWNDTHDIVGLGTAAALDAGVANGVATLDANGTVPTSQLPSLSGSYVPYTGATGAVDLNAKSLVNVSNLGVNTTTVPTIKIRAVGDNNSSSRIAMRGYSSDANSSAIRVTKFRGTAGAPQAPQSGDSLGKFELAGYGTTSSEGYPQASLEGVATENWGATARGAKAVVKVTPNTTITQVTALTINQDSSATFAGAISTTGLTNSALTSGRITYAGTGGVLQDSSNLTFDGNNLSVTGRGYIGTSTPQSPWVTGVTPYLSVEKSATYTGISAYSYSAGVTAGGILSLGHSKSATLGTLAATANGDLLGVISFEGVNSSSALFAGSYISSTQSGAADASYFPASLNFFTSNGTNNPAQNMTIFGTGGVSIGNTTDAGAGNLSVSGTVATNGIKFPATQVPSADANTLDDYEEGTWTPTVGGNATYLVQEGFYTKVGRIVTIQGKIQINAIGTGSTTTISGLPFAQLGAPNASNSGGGVSYFAGVASLVITLIPYVINGSTNIIFESQTVADFTSSNYMTTVFQSGTRVDFFLTYMAAS
jgi:hypothetical protein